MRCIKHFYQGLTWPRSRADWSTRQYSRCYAAGENTLMVLFFGIPISVCVGVGFLIGRLI